MNRSNDFTVFDVSVFSSRLAPNNWDGRVTTRVHRPDGPLCSDFARYDELTFLFHPGEQNDSESGLTIAEKVGLS